MGLLADLANELDAFKPSDMPEVAEFMESAEARLGSVTHQPAAAIHNAPTFPKVHAKQHAKLRAFCMRPLLLQTCCCALNDCRIVVTELSRSECRCSRSMFLCVARYKSSS